MTSGDDGAPRRRFIAGAVCPECGEMDRIVLEEAEAGSRRVCVACGFSDDMKPASGRLPPTRFDRRNAPTQSTPVRILDPKDGKN